MTGCPSPDTANDAHASDLDAAPLDAPETVHDCEAAMSLPRGTPCDFTDSCGMICPGMRVECREGRTVFFIGRCDTGAGPLDAFVVTSEAGAHDAGVMDDAASDVGMCMVREPTGATPCRSDADCSSASFERCRAPDERISCGICMEPPNDCVLDSDCPSMDGLQYVCEEAEVSCPCSGDGLGTYCIAPCSVTGCDDGFTCAASGHCDADPCTDDGYTCPLGTTCTPTGTSDDHGCLRTSCTNDGDCPCGAGCVEGRCYDVLGECEPPRA